MRLSHARPNLALSRARNGLAAVQALLCSVGWPCPGMTTTWAGLCIIGPCRWRKCARRQSQFCSFGRQVIIRGREAVDAFDAARLPAALLNTVGSNRHWAGFWRNKQTDRQNAILFTALDDVASLHKNGFLPLVVDFETFDIACLTNNNHSF